MKGLPVANIEKGIEKSAPKQRAYVTQFGRQINLSATLDVLEIGDSFVLDTDSMRTYALSFGIAKGMRLTSEQIEGGKYRIWRKS